MGEKIRKIYKKIAGGIMMAAIMTDLVSCAPTQQDNEALVCKMLEEKYKQEFEIVEYYGLDRWENSIHVLACSKEQSDILFEAEAAGDASYLSDEYVAACVYKKAEVRMEKNIQDIPGYIVLKVRSGNKAMDSSDYDMDIETFNEMKEGDPFVIYLFYAPKNADTEQVYKSIEDIAKGFPTLRGNIQLYIMDEKQLKEVQNYWEENANSYYGLDEMLWDVENIEIPFETEKILMAQDEFEDKTGKSL